MRQQVLAQHPRAKHIALDMIALSHEIASTLPPEARGDFITRAVWSVGDVMSTRMLADMERVPVAVLRGIVGKTA